MPDERSVFTEEELRRAMEQVVSKEEAADFAAAFYHGERGAPVAGSHEHWSEDTLDLLSLVSEVCAEKVRVILQIDEASAAKRREGARRRLGL